MIIGNKTYFSPKRYKLNHGSGCDVIYYKIISDMHTLYHRNIGPAVVSSDYFSWSFNGAEKRKDGPSFIDPSQGKYWNIHFTENCSEEKYWNY